MRPQIKRTAFNEPQWFVFHQRSDTAGRMVNIGHLTHIAESAVEARKALVPDCIGYIGCGQDLEEALRRAMAIDRHGGWEHFKLIDLEDLDYIEVGIGQNDQEQSAGLLPVSFDVGSAVGIRTEDLSALEKLAQVGVSFTASASQMTGQDMWPAEPGDADENVPSF